MNGAAPQGGSDVGFASQTEQADGQIAQGGHDLGCGAGAYLGAILIKGDVSNPVDPVLDAPVSTPEGKEPFGVGFFGRQAGDSVGQLAAGGAFVVDDALQPADLGQMRPVALTHQQVGGPQAQLFHPSAVLVDLDCLGVSWRFQFPDGPDVLLQRGLVLLYLEAVVPPLATTCRHTSRWVNWASPFTTLPSRSNCPSNPATASNSFFFAPTACCPTAIPA